MRTGRTIAILIGLALAMRLGGIVWWEMRLTKPFGFPDSESYWNLAADIAGGKPYEVGGAQVFRAPGYPLLLAPVVAAAGSGKTGIIAGRCTSAVLVTLAVGGVIWLGSRYLNLQCGLWAAGFCAVAPELVGLGVFVLSEAAFCPLLVLQLTLTLIAWQAADRRRAHGWSLAAGIVAGLASLVRPSWLLFVPFAAVVGAMVGPRRRQHVTFGLAAVLGTCLVMTPWWVRNARVTEHFVPTTLQVGASLYDGLNPAADGSSDMSSGDRLATEFRTTWNPAAGENFEYALDRHLRAAALTWASAHPVAVLELAAAKGLRMWNIWPNEPAFRSWSLRLAVLATYAPLLVLAIAGAWKLRHRGWATALLWLPAVYFTLIHAVFAASIRYRQPALFPLAVLAAAALQTWRPSDRNSLNR